MKYVTNYMTLDDLNGMDRLDLTVKEINTMINDLENYIKERVEGSILRFVKEKQKFMDHHDLYVQYDTLKLSVIAYITGRYGSTHIPYGKKRVNYKKQFSKLRVSLDLLHAFDYQSLKAWFDERIYEILN